MHRTVCGFEAPRPDRGTAADGQSTRPGRCEAGQGARGRRAGPSGRTGPRGLPHSRDSPSSSTSGLGVAAAPPRAGASSPVSPRLAAGDVPVCRSLSGAVHPRTRGLPAGHREPPTRRRPPARPEAAGVGQVTYDLVRTLSRAYRTPGYRCVEPLYPLAPRTARLCSLTCPP
ncbi:hypothetical protein GCM10010521_47550 [Streptomyces rameus]|uniref:Uncharacterized protein n=1 Tax=Streptomyces rameus TaxID=68261 RepID=A0ABP6NQQ3_9ACTN